MKYLKIEEDAVCGALAALYSAYRDEIIRAGCGQSWPARVERFKCYYDSFKATVTAAEIIEEEENETI